MSDLGETVEHASLIEAADRAVALDIGVGQLGRPLPILSQDGFDEPLDDGDVLLGHGIKYPDDGRRPRRCEVCSPRAMSDLEYTDPSAPHHHERHLRTPTHELSHEEKLRRQQTHLRILTGVVVLVLAMCVYAATSELDSWAEWAVFGGICSVAVGAIIALSPRRPS